MHLSARLTREELVAIVKAVFEYNGHTPVDVSFAGVDGLPVEITEARVTCQGGGLTVRVRPEDCTSAEELARAFSSLSFGGGNGA